MAFQLIHCHLMRAILTAAIALFGSFPPSSNSKCIKFVAKLIVIDLYNEMSIVKPSKDNKNIKIKNQLP